jgi:hypothetical protein
MKSVELRGIMALIAGNCVGRMMNRVDNRAILEPGFWQVFDACSRLVLSSMLKKRRGESMKNSDLEMKGYPPWASRYLGI